jgi:hypothetical protein
VYGTSPYPPPYPYPSQQTEGFAIGALICAIASFVVCPVIPAVAALILAQNARNRIDDSMGRLGGAGLVTAARVLAWIHLGLVMLVLLGLSIAGFVVAARG